VHDTLLPNSARIIGTAPTTMDGGGQTIALLKARQERSTPYSTLRRLRSIHAVELDRGVDLKTGKAIGGSICQQ
jgi:hypothetical protein